MPLALAQKRVWALGLGLVQQPVLLQPLMQRQGLGLGQL
jgi:hypothetical protein